jgi:NAD(P)H-hydrate epimerase
MLICSAKTIRAWDQYTIEQEPISSIDLMERAAEACAGWIRNNLPRDISFTVFCGPGNNGGDGLALARMLDEKGHPVRVFLLTTDTEPSPDNRINLERLRSSKIPVLAFDGTTELPEPDGSMYIDALFGTGLSRPLTGPAARVIHAMNHAGTTILSIDMPSGLQADQHSDPHVIITATHTLSFQCCKTAFLVAENARHIGQVHILDIGLSPRFPGLEQPAFIWSDRSLVAPLRRAPSAFEHKGSRGHAALLAGSWGMAGAAMLAAEACLRSGCGKLTVYADPRTYPMLQTALPEAIYAVHDSVHERSDHLSRHAYDAIGVGPGWGTGKEQEALLDELFRRDLPLVLDADALNTLAQHPDLLMKIPPGSILTPHPKEFERLFGKARDDFDRIRIARDKARYHNVNILLKGHNSMIVPPSGPIRVNATGNPGMATAGSGDVLTGILTGLLAQGYAPTDALVLGAWLHGRAGDLVAMD